MGWRGALRSYNAAIRAQERSSLQRAREIDRQLKQEIKLIQIERATLEVQEFDNRLEQICSVHKDCSNNWNWQELSKTPPPIEPQISRENQNNALQIFQNYSPSLWDYIFFLKQKKEEKFANQIELAKKKDEEAYQIAFKLYETERADWLEMTSLARKIMAGDCLAFHKAINELNPLQELNDFGSRLEIIFKDEGKAEIEFFVNGDQAIPSFSKSLLKNGSVCVKKIPQSKFLELYQDYVCGAVLRIARELFALLPLQSILINAISEMLDSSTGHMCKGTILSVYIPHATIQRLNFDTLDPSDALRNFNHKMGFKRNSGFSHVDLLIPQNQQAPFKEQLVSS